MEKGDLTRLKGTLDPYHQRRKDIHGSLYVVEKVFGSDSGLIEARSIATGVLLTLDRHTLEKAPENGTEL